MNDGRRYTAPPLDRDALAALVCSHCGALVADLRAHEQWHADTPTVAEVADRDRRLRVEVLDRVRRLARGDWTAAKGHDA